MIFQTKNQTHDGQHQTSWFMKESGDAVHPESAKLGKTNPKNRNDARDFWNANKVPVAAWPPKASSNVGSLPRFVWWWNHAYHIFTRYSGQTLMWLKIRVLCHVITNDIIYILYIWLDWTMHWFLNYTRPNAKVHQSSIYVLGKNAIPMHMVIAYLF